MQDTNERITTICPYLELHGVMYPQKLPDSYRKERRDVRVWGAQRRMRLMVSIRPHRMNEHKPVRVHSGDISLTPRVDNDLNQARKSS